MKCSECPYLYKDIYYECGLERNESDGVLTTTTVDYGGEPYNIQPKWCKLKTKDLDAVKTD